MATYKTKDGLDYLLPGIGQTVEGKIVTEHTIENVNFELIEDAPVAPPSLVAPIIGTPQTNTENN